MAWECEDIEVKEEKSDYSDVDENASTRDYKQTRILDACSRKNIHVLQFLAVSRGGFLSDAIRRQACKFPAEHYQFPGFKWRL